MRDDLAGVIGQDEEEAPLGAGQLQRLAALQHLPARQVDGDVAVERDDLRAGRLRQRRRHPAQDHLDARRQLAQAARLGHVVVGAALQPAHPIGLLPARAEHDDRHVGQLAQPGAGGPAVELGQHHVQDDQLRLPGVAEAQALLAVGGAPHLIPVRGQVVPQRLRERRVVFDEQ